MGTASRLALLSLVTLAPSAVAGAKCAPTSWQLTLVEVRSDDVDDTDPAFQEQVAQWRDEGWLYDGRVDVGNEFVLDVVGR